MRWIFAIAVLVPLSANARTQAIEANDGSVFHVDLDTIYRRGPNAAEVVVYGPGAPGDMVPAVKYMFDCLGHAMVVSGMHPSGSFYVAPRSVGGRVSQIACGTGKR